MKTITAGKLKAGMHLRGANDAIFCVDSVVVDEGQVVLHLSELQESGFNLMKAVYPPAMTFEVFRPPKDPR